MPDTPDPQRRKLSEIFSKDEIAALTARSDLMGWRALLLTWSVIGLTFAALAAWPHPALWLASLVILGGRQLSLAIMMHDAAHGTLFKSRRLNALLGGVCGSAVGVDIGRYRSHHLTHHASTGTDQDSDRSLSAPFPAAPASLARKFLRDLSGISGLKREYGLLLMHAGVLRWTVASDIVRLPRQGRRWRHYLGSLARNLWHPAAFQLALAGLLWAADHPALYLAWLAAYLTTYSLFMRVRSMAEHACTVQSADMMLNTRTTRAGPLARATVAPLNVNYHIEHHLMPAVPYHQLPAMHRMLRQKGLLAAPPGYLDVLHIVCARERHGA